MRLRVNLAVYLSSTAAEENDISNTTRQLLMDGFDEGGAQRVKVPVSTTNMEVTLRGLAGAGFIFLRSLAVDDTLTPVTLQIRLGDSSNDPIALTPMGTSKEGVMLLTTESVDSIYVTNTSTTVAMYLHIVSVGDAP